MANEALPRGHLVLFLHAHLPFVRHPEHEDFLEEGWLYEAMTETYLPLAVTMDSWLRAGHPARIAMSMTPPLCEMLRDDLLLGRYADRLDRLIGLAEREVKRTRDDPRFAPTAKMHLERLTSCSHAFNTLYDRDIVGAFARLQEEGVLEIATSAATHAFLPNFAFDPAFVRAQLKIGVRSYVEHFGRSPPGIWLPECGFFPGLDDVLADEGLCYFLVDAHGVLNAEPAPVLGTMSPLVCPSGVLAFPRDPESSHQVWSAEVGYPGDGRYLEFYRDIGYDLPEDHLDGFLLPTGGRRNVGIKYHRISSREVPLHEKQPYDRAAALEAVDSHAGNFIFNRMHQIDYWRREMKRPPVVVAPYDAELFGHWWAEGPEFIDLVMQKGLYDQDVYRMSTPGDVIRAGLEFQVARPSASSWGDRGHGMVWLNDRNDWMFCEVQRIAHEMKRLVELFPEPSDKERALLRQLGRELLLASASDWPFIITMGTTTEYAEARVRRHVDRFDLLRRHLLFGRESPEAILEIEAQDTIFSRLDHRHFAGVDDPGR